MTLISNTKFDFKEQNKHYISYVCLIATQVIKNIICGMGVAWGRRIIYMYLSVLGMKLICKYEIGLSERKIGFGSQRIDSIQLEIFCKNSV